MLLSALCMLTLADVDAQKIEGQYYPEKDSFVIKETPYSRSLFKIQNPCIGGYCVLEGTNYQGLGIIDTSGLIVFEPQKNAASIQIISTAKNTFFKYKYNNYSLLICKDKPTLSSKTDGRYFYMYSDSVNDVFFEEKKTSNGSDFNESEGVVFGISTHQKTPLYEGNFLTENNYIYYSESGKKKSQSNYFYKNLLIYKNKDNQYTIKNLDGSTYIKTPNIKSIMGMEKLTYISEAGYGFELHEYDSTDRVVDQFESYKIIYTPKEHVLYRKNGKHGCYVGKYNYKKGGKSTNTLYHIPPIFDSISIGNSYYNRYSMFKGDTIFTYNSLDYYDTFNYNKSFVYAHKRNKRGTLTLIGRNGAYDIKGPQLQLGGWAPQSGWAGLGLNSREVLRKDNPKDTVSINALSLEAGLGWYSLETDGNFLISSWNLHGGGIGLEYRTPFMLKDSIKSITGSKYRRTYLNARAEYATGVGFLFLPLSIHLQLGYSTNFKEHFIRPGVGMSFVNLMIGIEGNLPLKNDNYLIGEFGIYMRYIITEE